MNNFKLVNTTSTPENLVIFLHGFTGTDDTWEMKDGSMPFIDALLKEEPIVKETYNIGLFFYTSDFFGGDKSGNILTRGVNEFIRKNTSQQQYNQPIHKIAGMLASEINLYLDENDLEKVNLTLIAHSMGGLVSKCFIIENVNDKRYNLKAFHSIHVPHQGSELAIIGNTFLSNQQKIDLKPNSEIIKDLNDKWLKLIANKLPYTYYYISENDNTVLGTSAYGSEKRKEKTGFEKISHNGGHSDFLSGKDNVVWRKVRIALKKRQELKSLEKASTTLTSEEENIERIIENLYDQVDINIPECKEFTCFRFQKATLFDKIYNYTNAMSSELNDNRELFDAEIDAIFDSITAYLIDDTPMDLDNFTFTYESTYKYIFDAIKSNLLHKCNCQIKQKIDKLMFDLQEAELAFS